MPPRWAAVDLDHPVPEPRHRDLRGVRPVASRVEDRADESAERVDGRVALKATARVELGSRYHFSWVVGVRRGQVDPERGARRPSGVEEPHREVTRDAAVGEPHGHDALLVTGAVAVDGLKRYRADQPRKTQADPCGQHQQDIGGQRNPSPGVGAGSSSRMVKSAHRAIAVPWRGVTGASTLGARAGGGLQRNAECGVHRPVDPRTTTSLPSPPTPGELSCCPTRSTAGNHRTWSDRAALRRDVRPLRRPSNRPRRRISCSQPNRCPDRRLQKPRLRTSDRVNRRSGSCCRLRCGDRRGS